jgi:hypothetical protein
MSFALIGVVNVLIDTTVFLLGFPEAAQMTSFSLP